VRRHARGIWPAAAAGRSLSWSARAQGADKPGSANQQPPPDVRSMNLTQQAQHAFCAGR